MAQPLTDAINALTAYANTVTGASDTTLSDAVATLASGYGGGGNDLVELLDGTTTVLNNNDIASVRYCQGNRSLTSVNLPNCLYVGIGGFRECANLETFSLPKCETIEANAFRSCKLRGAVLPKAKTIGVDAFYLNANYFEYADIGNATDNVIASVGAYAFEALRLHTLLIIRYPAVATLANVNAFSNGAFASNGVGGALYVPQALISSYQTASNWSTILGYANNSIQAIEGSYYETHYADGTPIE